MAGSRQEPQWTRDPRLRETFTFTGPRWVQVHLDSCLRLEGTWTGAVGGFGTLGGVGSGALSSDTKVSRGSWDPGASISVTGAAGYGRRTDHGAAGDRGTGGTWSRRSFLRTQPGRDVSLVRVQGFSGITGQG